MSVIELDKSYKDMKNEFNKSNLSAFGIRLPKENTQKGYTLLYYFNNINKVVNKSEIEDYVCNNLNIKRRDIQACRHLAKQDGFNILQSTSSKLLKRGQYVFLGFDKPNKYYSFNRRNGSVINFDDIKKQFNNKCATCGCEEGSYHRYTGEIVKLEKAHKNPDLPLDNNNTIPQCNFCNQKYKDNYIFDNYGQVKKPTKRYIKKLMKNEL